jgi:hypothetical protein
LHEPDYANPETVEKIRNQLMVDKEYMQKLGPYPELLVEGSVHGTAMFAL